MLCSMLMVSVRGHELKCANGCVLIYHHVWSNLLEVMNATTSENALMRGPDYCATLNGVSCRYLMWNDCAISCLSSSLLEASENRCEPTGRSVDF